MSKGEGAIDGGAGDRLVALTGPFEELLGGEVLVGIEHGIDDRLPLRGDAQVLAHEEIHEPGFARCFVPRRHSEHYKMWQRRIQVLGWS